MKLKATSLFAALLAVCCAGTANAVNWPPGLDNCLPDSSSVTIKYLQTSTYPCRPTHLDLVYGVRARISALKTQGTSRSFYLQNNASNQAFTGLDCFNGNPNFQTELSLGDSVVVYGKVDTSFGGKAGFYDSNETELVGIDTDNNTAIDFAIISQGTEANLPPWHTTSLTEIRFPAINWQGNVAASAASGEPWENMLVKIIGPFVVGKRAFVGGGAEATYPGIETRSPNGGGMLVTTAAGGDSILVDMTSFVTQTPEPVGTEIDSIFGILQQRSREQQNAFRIAIRSSGDIFYRLPPNVTDAFPVANDSVRVQFDTEVTTGTATQAVNYSLDSERPIDFCRMDGDNAVVCHIGSAGSLAIGELETITVTGITNAVNGLTITSPQNLDFHTGILPITSIQAPMPESLSVCVDRSKYAGPGITDGHKLSFVGVVTGFFLGREYYVQDEAGGPRSGIKIFAPATMIVGHRYLVATVVTEFLGETEANRPTYLKDLGVGTTPPFFTGTVAQLDDFTCDPTNTITNGEDYEGSLVDFSHVLRTRPDAGIANAGGFFHASNATLPNDSTDIEIDAGAATGYDPQPDEYIVAKGVLSYRFSQGVVFPRSDADLVKVGAVDVGGSSAGRISFAAYPNPARVTEFRFALPRRGDVELAVFDLLGRKLATVARGSLAAGAYTRKWDGRTDTGGQANSGVYFYRLKVGQEVFNLRGVRLN